VGGNVGNRVLVAKKPHKSGIGSRRSAGRVSECFPLIPFPAPSLNDANCPRSSLRTLTLSKLVL
jgi:hypothetical protein